ncbi:hypothetical protein D9619_000993 [Psilocybe cf. subviscida]|uniref:WKF domain-containing protein n=1 Tax=Psilocybe cf. subviscida TaxID=2480587 RepID=A0A8H5F2K9_9AGAR|nr:hypothetical protein D9619_000993 [Psilocybe cf. subviscida]
MGKKSSKEIVQEETPVIEATEAKQSKKKSKPTKPEDIQQADADGTKPAGVSAKELKKKLRESRTIRPAVPELPIPEEIKKSKKRKHRSENAEEKPVAPVEEEEPPKKKRKNRTEFADPRVDASLNSQARKALEYAFTQMNKPKKWRFNKARQNWLIRNVWAPESISDAYFPLVIKYLQNVQGGSREKLKETCELHLKVPDVDTPAEKNTPPATATTEQPKSILKTTAPTTTTDSSAAKPTPGSLISPAPGPLITPTPGPLIAGPLVDTPATVKPGPKAEALLAEIRRSRAHTILAALNSDSKTDDEDEET